MKPALFFALKQQRPSKPGRRSGSICRKNATPPCVVALTADRCVVSAQRSARPPVRIIWCRTVSGIYPATSLKTIITLSDITSMSSLYLFSWSVSRKTSFVRSRSLVLNTGHTNRSVSGIYPVSSPRIPEPSDRRYLQAPPDQRMEREDG